ncbi:MAG: hypothetical protein Q8P92_03060 [Candidatus Daviesbacteria bacterium]|nr:hypothetical protein [Candidatus Daviesbacteria bacterium]
MKRGYRFQVLGYSLLFFLLSTVTCTLSPIYAADSTPSASIQSKLDELKKEIASKAAKLKGAVDKKLTDKAYIGTIKAKSETTITLATDTDPKVININEDTVFESEVKGVRNVSLKTLETEDYIAALGDIDDTQVLTAKKIVLYPEPAPKKEFVWGQIISISDKLITLKNNQSKNIAVSYSGDEDFKVNNFVILTGNYNENDVFEAEFLYVIKTGGILKPNKEASPTSQIVEDESE